MVSPRNGMTMTKMRNWPTSSTTSICNNLNSLACNSASWGGSRVLAPLAPLSGKFPSWEVSPSSLRKRGGKPLCRYGGASPNCLRIYSVYTQLPIDFSQPWSPPAVVTLTFMACPYWTQAMVQSRWKKKKNFLSKLTFILHKRTRDDNCYNMTQSQHHLTYKLTF